MCGVAAVLRWDGIGALAVAQAMMSRARHRGPDGHGSCVVARGPSHEVAFAHARLAILGLGEQGAQPFVRGPVTLTYNGEIYNYRELRQELRALGHRIDGTGDTEVLAAAWEAWGAGCLPRLDGMFAFVLWDARDGRLYAARDAFGIKPLHWARTQGGVAIASEVPQFVAIGDWRPEPDLSVAGAFLSLGLHDTDPNRTFLRSVSRVAPGTLLAWDPARGDPEAVTTFRPVVPPVAAVSGWNDALRTVRSVIESAVASHLVSDVPVGSCASGGLDSSIVVACAARRAAKGLNLFHARTSVHGFDESGFASELALRHGARLHFVDTGPNEFRDHFDEVARAQGEPFGDGSVLAQWLVMRRAREVGVPVLLDGQGADEAFMGYAKYHAHEVRARMRRRQPLAAAVHASQVALFGYGGGLRIIAKAQRHLPARFRFRLALPDWAIGPDPEWEAWRRITKDADEVARQDISRWSLPLLLRLEDRNSMAHGIESRVPYVSAGVILAARAIPSRFHLRGGLSKAVLRAAFEDVLPRSVVRRRVRFGFVTGWDAWSRPGGPIDGWLRRRAASGPVLPRILAAGGAGSLERLQSSRNGREALFRMLSLDAWASELGVEVGR